MRMAATRASGTPTCRPRRCACRSWAPPRSATPSTRGRRAWRPPNASPPPSTRRMLGRSAATLSTRSNPCPTHAMWLQAASPSWEALRRATSARALCTCPSNPPKWRACSWPCPSPASKPARGWSAGLTRRTSCSPAMARRAARAGTQAGSSAPRNRGPWRRPSRTLSALTSRTTSSQTPCSPTPVPLRRSPPSATGCCGRRGL
mmetsp:Transcript_676/g.1684  ORF Transcript_676/g.1684 Transcript_676/m.1684 type:complete len:204 (-) Transcript_676:496-1107(-)